MPCTKYLPKEYLIFANFLCVHIWGYSISDKNFREEGVKEVVNNIYFMVRLTIRVDQLFVISSWVCAKKKVFFGPRTLFKPFLGPPPPPLSRTVKYKHFFTISPTNLWTKYTIKRIWWPTKCVNLNSMMVPQRPKASWAWESLEDHYL